MRQQVALFKGMPCEAIIWKHEYLVRRPPRSCRAGGSALTRNVPLAGQRRGSTMDDVRACRSKEKAKLQKTSASKARVVEAGRKEIGKTGDVASANEFPETSAAPKRDQEMIDTSLMATFASDDPFNQGPRSEICGQEGGSDLEAPGAVSHSPEAFPGYLATGPLTPGNSEASFSFPFLSVPSMEPPHIPSTHELATSLAVQNARQLSCRVHWPFEAAACDQCHSARMFDHADVLAVMPDSIRFAI